MTRLITKATHQFFSDEKYNGWKKGTVPHSAINKLSGNIILVLTKEVYNTWI